MKNIIQKIIETFTIIYQFIVKYRVTLFTVATAAVLSIMLIDISMMSNAEPTELQLSEAEKSIKIIKFKDESIKVVQSLEENNIKIDTLFDPNRYDPFR